MGRASAFDYDADGRITQATLPGGRIVAAAYDANGNVTSITPPTRPAHTFAYTSVDQQQTYTPPDVPGDGTRSTSYTHDVDRALSRVDRPDGRTVTPAYDSTTGRLTSLAWSAGTETFAYDSAGRPSSIAAPSGVTNTFLP